MSRVSEPFRLERVREQPVYALAEMTQLERNRKTDFVFFRTVSALTSYFIHSYEQSAAYGHQSRRIVQLYQYGMIYSNKADML